MLPLHRRSSARSVFTVSALAAVFFAANAQAQDLGVGVQTFNDSCAHCHGANGQGGVLAPSLLKRVAGDDDAALMAFLKVGNPTKGMPPAGLADNQYPDLMGYLRYLSANVADATYSTDGTRNQYSSMPSIENFKPVTEAMLLNPDPADWLWYSRTADAQRFSPLDQINRSNVKQLGLAWSRGLPAGVTETIPTVYNGVMYLTLPGSNVAALDATTGDTIWEYKRDYVNPGTGGSGRSKSLAIYEDMVYFAAPDDTLVALDARTGAVRWEAPTTPGRGNTSGAIVAEGVVVTSGTCRTHSACAITGHDARTGELKWTFMVAQEPDDADNPDSWAGLAADKRRVSSWGLPGGYDAETHTLFWSVANPSPYTRLERHGDADAIPAMAPADLYSNSTLALDAQTGKLKWYYQHLPGDDWDEDMNEERLIIRTKVNPDPTQVKWISPKIAKGGEERDIIVNVGEGGGIWALDKHNGEFLWAAPFPFEHPNFLISDIDVETGRTVINRDVVVDAPGAHRIVCFFNTRSYWPGAYNPRNNSLYMPYINNCLNMTAASPATETMPATPESRIGMPAPGLPLDELNGLAKINMETGEMTHWITGRIPTTSSILATAGDLIFWGDINRRFRAQDAETGEVLWETIVGGPLSSGNITYSVNGRQYIAILTGNNLSHPGLNTGTMGPIRLNLSNSADSNSVYVFALPQ
ncbi:MAG: PQQ-binding-like beta-propeller repeat protein [Pseudomonadales bacterium]|jgi:alcohol dehydrogenase (cytochrome c)|nr:PQQ-binding-like beta-propeller repeat protein [Pseudomonadales bacterium]